MKSDWDWSKDALCLEYPEVDFYPNKSDTSSVKKAKRICKQCLVRDECLDFAYRNKEVGGIWGGFFEDERKKVVMLRKVVTVRETSVSVRSETVPLQVSTFQLRL